MKSKKNENPRSLRNNSKTGLYLGTGIFILYIIQGISILKTGSLSDILLHLLGALIAGTFAGLIYNWVIKKSKTLF